MVMNQDRGQGQEDQLEGSNNLERNRKSKRDRRRNAKKLKQNEQGESDVRIVFTEKGSVSEVKSKQRKKR